MRMMGKISISVSALKSKINFFYLLAFVPLVLISYFKYVSGVSILGALIPFYGFLLLFFKRDRLSLCSDAGRLQQLVGLAVMLVGLFAFYIMTNLYSFDFYGTVAAFYASFLLGLFLAFFSASALRESVSVFFLVVVGSSSYYLGEWLEYFLEPLVPYFVQIMVVVLLVLGVPVAIHNPRTIMLKKPEGPVPVTFEAGCIGIWSFLVFSVIIVVTMIEESASIRTKLLWSLGSVIGTFAINIIRVSLISAVIYHFGYENWGWIHAWIGYALFLAWLGFFFVIFSNREVIRNEIRALWQKL